MIFTLIYSYSGLAIAIFSFMLYSYKYTTTIVVGFALFWFILLAFYPVYTKARDRIRVQLNLATIVFTQSAYIVDTIWPNYS